MSLRVLFFLVTSGSTISFDSNALGDSDGLLLRLSLGKTNWVYDDTILGATDDTFDGKEIRLLDSVELGIIECIIDNNALGTKDVALYE